MRVAGERRDTLPGGLPMDGASTNPGLVPVLLPYDEARRGDRPPEEVPTVAPRSPALPTPLLDGREWRAWSEARARAGDGWLGGLAREVAQALEGEPGTAPEAPRWLLGEPERAQLLPRELSGPLAGMLSACGVALLAASSETQGPPPGQPFTAGAGPGAPAALEALASAVRVLGLRSPPPGCMAQAGPPFALGAGAGGAVRLQVGAFAVQRTLPAGELRFFAGRALFTQLPLLRVLRLVPPEQLEALLSALPAAVRGGRRLAPAAHALRAHLPGDLRSQLAGTLGALGDAPPLEELAMCARHAANRAGLVTCGGVGAAVLALRSKRALDEEVAELLRFVASDGWRVLAAPWYPLSAPPAAGR
ncbi:MAG: hypothetical protein FJ086_08030 [Deltaproteobacteria bacterium]|nr:hypothetical protein [Deltaproteobacteria bacterium]